MRGEKREKKRKEKKGRERGEEINSFTEDAVGFGSILLEGLGTKRREVKREKERKEREERRPVPADGFSRQVMHFRPRATYLRNHEKTT